MSKTILYVSYFECGKTQRQEEFKHCLLTNIKNRKIDKVVVLLEGKKADYKWLSKSKKVRLIESPRPKFKDFFNVANQISGPEDYSIIANSDIYFDGSIDLLRTVDIKDTCFALSRYHYYTKESIILHNEKFSQDVWIFQGKIRDIGYCDFEMGIAGCDNRIAYEIHKAGYNILNPAHSIKCVHYHADPSRDYHHLGKVQKPYLAVPVIALPGQNEPLPKNSPDVLLNAEEEWKPKRRNYPNVLKTW